MSDEPEPIGCACGCILLTFVLCVTTLAVVFMITFTYHLLQKMF